MEEFFESNVVVSFPHVSEKQNDSGVREFRNPTWPS